MRLVKFTLLMLSQFITLFLNLLIQIILAHNYSTKDTGVYFSIFALTNILISIGLFGINKYYIYIKSKDNIVPALHVNAIVKLFIITNIISIIILIVWGGLKFPEYIFFIISNALMAILTNVIAILTSFIQMKNKIATISIFQLIIPIIKASGLIFGIYIIYHHNFNGYSLFVSIFSLILLYFFYMIYFREYKIEDISINKEHIKIFIEIIPYALLSILFTTYTQGNTFYIGILETPEKAAYFAIAYMFINTIFIFPIVLYQKILAHRILKLIYNNLSLFKENYVALQELVILASSFCMICIYIFSDFLIITLFGDKYYESIRILNLLLLIVPFRLITISIGTILSTNENIYKRIGAEFLICIINIVLNFLLIPVFGVNGAIISVIITEVVLSMLFTYIIEQRYKVHIDRILYLSFIPICLVIMLNESIFRTLIIGLLCLVIFYIPIKRRIQFLWKNL